MRLILCVKAPPPPVCMQRTHWRHAGHLHITAFVVSVHMLKRGLKRERVMRPSDASACLQGAHAPSPSGTPSQGTPARRSLQSSRGQHPCVWALDCLACSKCKCRFIPLSTGLKLRWARRQVAYGLTEKAATSRSRSILPLGCSAAWSRSSQTALRDLNLPGRKSLPLTSESVCAGRGP